MMLRRSFISILLILSLVIAPSGFTNTVSGSNGVVSSRSQLASDVGVEILRQGGNAVDAAVATAFALAVTYPSAGNIGGGGFMVIRLDDGTVVTQDHREKAPGTAFPDMFLDDAGNVDRRKPLYSAQAAGVPGSVAGLLDALERYGSMSREQVIAPAIKLAEEGFPLSVDLAQDFERVLNSMRDYPASMAVFSNNGQPWQAGEVWVQKDLAETLKRISAEGRDGFYKGKTADLLVAEMQRLDGMISHEDLAAYNAEWREPIKGSYRGYDIWSMPPPSSGGALVVQMLNMLEAYDVKSMGWGSAETIHLMVEAQRRAYADRAEHMGDPDFYPVPLDMLTDKNYARQRFLDFNPDQASRSADIGSGSWPMESTETTHFSVMDKNGVSVSLTTTLNLGYGNRIVVPGAGFLLNNEMDDFSAKPNEPNAYGLLGDEANKIEPGKRMLSSMTPTIVTRNGEPVLITGSPGGSTIINTVFQVMLNVLDHEMSIEDAVASPRIHHQWQPDMIRVEPGALQDGAQQRLEAMGHIDLAPMGYGLGDANSILLQNGVMHATSDPRSDGGASAY
jgi:gamma-glutamyltranspeptidase / glutathione hydrolase